MGILIKDLKKDKRSRLHDSSFQPEKGPRKSIKTGHSN